MEYLHIKNLEKYHPGYKDRTLQWAKIYFKMVQGNPECEMITNEIDWARLVKFILLELQARRPIPLDNLYLTRKGFDMKKRHLSKTLSALESFIVILSVYEMEEFCNETVTKPLRKVYVDKEKDKEKDKEEVCNKPTYKEYLHKWNALCDIHPVLPKIRSISSKRRYHLDARHKTKDFADNYDNVLAVIATNSFLKGDNSKKWVADFDWIIKNDDNYSKILEGKYKDKTKQQGRIYAR